MFDPEKVERFDSASIAEDGSIASVTSAVRASDYDQLLSLYREARSSLDAVQQTSPSGFLDALRQATNPRP